MFGIENHDGPIIAGFMLLSGIIEAIGGLYKNSKRTKDDWWIEIMRFIHSSTVSKPLIVLVTTFLILRLVPQWEAMFREVSLWYTLPFVVLSAIIF